MNFTLKVWRQKCCSEPGRFETYDAKDIPAEASFLEMLDVVNDRLRLASQVPISFDNDCREGICGACGMVINGLAHGIGHGATTCQLYMRSFKDGETITIEPWRAKAFPVIKDLVVNRSALDTIIQSGGFISVNTGGAPDGNAIPIPKPVLESAMDSAACIGCGACVAACKNGSAMLFTGAKVAHLAKLPQGKLERYERVRRMVETMDSLGFGNCTNEGECEARCPKQISLANIAQLNREFLLSKILG